MLGFAAKRLLLAVLTVVIVSVIVFFLVHAMPGSPGVTALGEGGSAAQIAAYNKQIGWDDPLWRQYLAWASNAIHGNFGVSLVNGQSVAQAISQRLPVTASIAIGGTILSAILGVAIGVAGAVRGGIVDKVSSGYSGIAASLPPFWLGIVLVFLFAVQTSILPATGYVPFATSPTGWATSLVLPVVTLAIGGSAFIARQTRSSMLDALGQEHMKTLRATATPQWKIIYIHALRYASLPIIASIALQFIGLFGGSVIAEQLFALPGIGAAVQSAVGSNDVTTVQGTVVIATIIVVAVNLVLELATRFLDPKLRTI